MRRSIKTILTRTFILMLVMALCFLSYLAGIYTTRVSYEREKAETISKNSVQPETKKIYVTEDGETGIVAGYDDSNRLVSVDNLPTTLIPSPWAKKSPVYTPTLTPKPTETPTEAPKQTSEPVLEDETVNESPSTGTLLGSDFKLYHYAPTGNATASGRMPEVGVTVAVDPRYIKLGSWLRIEVPDGNGGYKVYKQKVRADDTGKAIKGHVLDIFVGSESEANQCGVIRNAKVYLVEE